MGLDLDCDGMSVRVGSYSHVHDVRRYLIDTIKNYIEKSDDFLGDKEELLKDIDECYTNYHKIMNLQLYLYDLEGFECFIYHSDCSGSIDSSDAYNFVKLCDKLKDYFDKDNFYYEGDNFYLYDIFKHSSETGEDIYFC